MTRLLPVPLMVFSLLALLNGCSFVQRADQSGYNQTPQASASSTNTPEDISNATLVGQSTNINISELSPKDEIQDPAPELSPFPTEGIPVLMYHSISTLPGNNLGVPVTQFAEEIKWLKSRNYSALSLEDFYQALVQRKPVPPKPILITFDDGYLDNYQAAWPILQKYGFQATFFIITDAIGTKMMNWEQINELADQGNSIASHTRTHPDLSTLSIKQLEKELAQSKKDLESNIGRNVDALCFPSGRFNAQTLEMMPRLGYKLGFTTKPGKVHLGDDPLTLKRIRIPGGMPLTDFKNQFP